MAKQKLTIELPDFSDVGSLKQKESMLGALFSEDIEARSARTIDPELHAFAVCYQDIREQIKRQYHLNDVSHQQVINYMAGHLDEMRDSLARPKNIDGVDCEVTLTTARTDFVSVDDDPVERFDEKPAPPIPARAPKRRRRAKPADTSGVLNVTEEDLYQPGGQGQGDTYEGDPSDFAESDEKSARAQGVVGGDSDSGAGSDEDDYALPVAPRPAANIPPQYAEPEELPAASVQRVRDSAPAVPQPAAPHIILHDQWKSAIKRMATEKGNLNRLEALLGSHDQVVFAHPDPTSSVAIKDFQKLGDKLMRLRDKRNNRQATNEIRSASATVHQHEDHSLAAGLAKKAADSRPTAYKVHEPTQPASDGAASGEQKRYANLDEKGLRFGREAMTVGYSVFDEDTRGRVNGSPGGYANVVQSGPGYTAPAEATPDHPDALLYASAVDVGELSIEVDLKDVVDDVKAQQVATSIVGFAEESGEANVGMHFSAGAKAERQQQAAQFVDRLTEYYLDRADATSDEDEASFANFYNTVTGEDECSDDLMDDLASGGDLRAGIKTELVEALSKPPPRSVGSVMYCVHDGHGSFEMTPDRPGPVASPQRNAPVPGGQHPKHGAGRSAQDDLPATPE